MSENLESLRSQRTKLQHAMERLIDSFTEGWIEKDQFTTRMARTKTRIADLDSKLEKDAAMSISGDTFDVQQLGFEKSESGSVAAILERELEPTVREWVRRVNLISELTDIPLSDADRSGHLTSQGASPLISR